MKRILTLLLCVVTLTATAEKQPADCVNPFIGTTNFGTYRADRRFGDAIFLMDPGIQIAPSDMGLKPLNGMHGFAPEDKDSQAVIMSTDEIPSEVRHVADYFALMKRRIAE